MIPVIFVMIICTAILSYHLNEIRRAVVFKGTMVGEPNFWSGTTSTTGLVTVALPKAKSKSKTKKRSKK